MDGISCQSVWPKPNIASDNPNALGAPENFEITIREVVPKLGAGFIVALTGMWWPCLVYQKRPAALNMDVAADGTAIGLF